MTSYWKPRWPDQVFFGSYRELNYRLDLAVGGRALFRLRTSSGPGFAVTINRSAGGFETAGEVPARARECWFDDPAGSQAIGDILGQHFSILEVRPDSIVCVCDPAQDDLLPEGAQLGWCLERIYSLWCAVPAEERKAMSRAEFLE